MDRRRFRMGRVEWSGLDGPLSIKLPTTTNVHVAHQADNIKYHKYGEDYVITWYR
jgi:hypothetical protein